MARGMSTGHHSECPHSESHEPTFECNQHVVPATVHHSEGTHETEVHVHHEDVESEFIEHCKEIAEAVKKAAEAVEEKKEEGEKAYTVVTFADGTTKTLQHSEQSTYTESQIEFKQHGKVTKVEIHH